MKLFCWWFTKDDTKVNPLQDKSCVSSKGKVPKANKSPSPSLVLTKSKAVSLALPSTLSAYRIGKKLGSGSYGDCFQVVLRSTGEQFAAKRIPKRHLTMCTPCVVRHELEIHRQLSHPNVVQLHHFIETNKECVFILTLCDKRSLLSMLNDTQGHLSFKIVQRLARQLAQGLRYVHAQGIVHCDIKLENLLFLKDQIQIADFGLAYDAKSHPFQTDCVGSLVYIAPEVITARKTNTSYNASIDIWSSGVVLYMLCEKRSPFKFCETSKSKSFQHILHDDVHFSPHVPGELRDLISGMLEKNPAKRLTWDQVLIHPFFAVVY